MRSSKRVAKAALSTALVLAMGVATLFNAGTSYAAEEVKLNKTSRNILTRQSYDFDVVGAPKDAVITWKSSDSKIATVDEDGVVYGIKKGNVTITCEVTSAGKTQKLTAKAKIRKPAVKIEIKNKITELEYGKKYDLNRTLTPKTSNDVTTWKSSNTKIATVDKNGVVKALKEGKVTITATTMSGKTDSVEIKVYGGPDATPTPKPTATPKPQKPSKPVSNAVYEQNFESDMGGWFDRGSMSTVKGGASSPAGGKFLEVTGRSSNWNGPGYEMMNVLKAGKEYNVTAYVKQNNADGEVIKLTSDKNAGTQYTNISVVTTKKGEWTLLEGTLSVDKDTTSLVLYFEADNVTLDFMIDAVKVVDPNASASDKPATVASKYTFAQMTQPEDKGKNWACQTAVNGGKLTMTSDAGSIYTQSFWQIPDGVDMAKVKKVTFNGVKGAGVEFRLMTAGEYTAYDGSQNAEFQSSETVFETKGAPIAYFIVVSKDGSEITIDSISFE